MIKMKYLILMCPLLGFLTNSLWSQSEPKAAIFGKVVEYLTEEPVEFAEVVLYKADDSTLVQGVTTNNVGEFRLNNIPVGRYNLKVSFIAFQTKWKKVSIDQDDQQLDLGKILLELSTFMLEEVEIAAEKSTYNLSLDRKIYNVENDIMSQTGSATDILQNLPSVSVDVNGQVRLRGTPNVQYLINGKPSALLRANSAAALQQIPANTIERVEVITNPSARYRPDGVGGIINIVLKEKALDGLNATIQGNIGNLNRQNANLTLNYHTGDVNIFGSYGFKNSSTPQDIFDTRIERDGLGNEVTNYQSNSDVTFGQFSHVANAGVSFPVGEKGQFELSGNFFFGKNDNHSLTNWVVKDDVESRFNIDRTYTGFEKEYELAAAFEHEFEEDHSLAIEIAHATYSEREDNFYDEKYTLPSVAHVVSGNYIKKGGPLTEIAIDYGRPLGDEWEMEAGYLGEFLKDDINILGEKIQDNVWTVNLNRTYHFKFDQTIHAGYGMLGRGFGAFSFMAGLRAEQALVTSNLLTTSEVIPNDYFRLYPSLNLTYEFSEFNNIQFNYSKRVNRADPDEQNPFPEYDDPRTRDAGNPLLKPEQVHSLELGYQLKTDNLTFMPSLFYRYKYDGFTELREIQEDSILHTTFINFDKEQLAGLELIMTGNIKDRLQYNLNSMFYYNEIDGTSLGLSSNKSNFSWEAKLAANASITKSTYLQVNAHYLSARLTPQGEFQPLFLLNFGARQDILKKRASIVFTVSDVFASLEWESVIDTKDLYWKTTYGRNNQIFYVGFTYNFRHTGRSLDNIEFEDQIEETNLKPLEEEEE